MFKAFYWMFQKPENKKVFIKNCTILFGILLIFMFILCAMMYLVFTGSVLSFLMIFICPLLMIPGLLTCGYFWELTSNVIERKTDIISSNIYGGRVKLAENIEIPAIKFFSYIWRGIAGSFAILIMETPVIVLLVYIIIFGKQQLFPALIAIQILIWFLSPGLFWNYAKNNSIFSMFNLYAAGHLFENKPGRYIWNSVLIILTWLMFTVIVGFAEYAIGLPARSDINNMTDIIKFVLSTLIFYLPYVYVQHVYAFLIGTLGNSNDF